LKNAQYICFIMEERQNHDPSNFNLGLSLFPSPAWERAKSRKPRTSSLKVLHGGDLSSNSDHDDSQTRFISRRSTKKKSATEFQSSDGNRLSSILKRTSTNNERKSLQIIPDQELETVLRPKSSSDKNSAESKLAMADMKETTYSGKVSDTGRPAVELPDDEKKKIYVPSIAHRLSVKEPDTQIRQSKVGVRKEISESCLPDGNSSATRLLEQMRKTVVIQKPVRSLTLLRNVPPSSNPPHLCMATSTTGLDDYKSIEDQNKPKESYRYVSGVLLLQNLIC